MAKNTKQKANSLERKSLGANKSSYKLFNHLNNLHRPSHIIRMNKIVELKRKREEIHPWFVNHHVFFFFLL